MIISSDVSVGRAGGLGLFCSGENDQAHSRLSEEVTSDDGDGPKSTIFRPFEAH